jgi:hypothetical protein
LNHKVRSLDWRRDREERSFPGAQTALVRRGGLPWSLDSPGREEKAFPVRDSPGRKEEAYPGSETVLLEMRNPTLEPRHPGKDEESDLVALTAPEEGGFLPWSP